MKVNSYHHGQLFWPVSQIDIQHIMHGFVCVYMYRHMFLPLQTFPEIIPFIEVCVKMMEQVYNVPVDIDTATTTNDRGQPTQV